MISILNDFDSALVPLEASQKNLAEMSNRTPDFLRAWRCSKVSGKRFMQPKKGFVSIFSRLNSLRKVQTFNQSRVNDEDEKTHQSLSS